MTIMYHAVREMWVPITFAGVNRVMHDYDIGQIGKNFMTFEEAVKYIEEELKGELTDRTYACAIDAKVWMDRLENIKYWVERVVYDDEGNKIYEGP